MQVVWHTDQLADATAANRSLGHGMHMTLSESTVDSGASHSSHPGKLDASIAISVMATTRESMSSEEIATLINDSINVVPGLANVKVSVIRLPNPEIEGCNWIAHFGAMPSNCSPESQKLIRDIVENAQTYFNLWEMH